MVLTRSLRPLTLALSTLAAAGGLASADTQAHAQTKLVRQAQGAIPNQYIVVMKQPAMTAFAAPDVAVVKAGMDQLASRHNASVSRHYTAALRGFVATMSDADAAALAADPDVAYVVEDKVMSIDGLVQNQAIWNLDRIDQASLPLDTKHVSLGDGMGATVYVIDTGIRPSHLEFTGRLLPGYSAINDGRGTTDCQGHGTHVAGTVGGTTWGVAKKASIVPVRVFDCNGQTATSNVIAGIDWVTANKRPNSVANLSLGGPADPSVDQAIVNLVNAGVTVVVAAGNETQDACNVSPARVPAAITVAATTEQDGLATFSNFGTCVDIAAPGTNIVSASYQADNQGSILSGTSMASPAVAGAAAVFLGANPNTSPAQVAAALTGGSVPNKIANPKGSPNRLLNTTFVDKLAPTNVITSPADGATVATSFTLKADVADPNLASVELAIDGQVLGSAASLPIVFDIQNLAPGPHAVTVIATDLAGQQTSTSINITVDADMEPEEPSGGDGSGTETGQPGDPSGQGSAPDVVGGCNAGGKHGGSLVFALIALALFRRRSQPARV